MKKTVTLGQIQRQKDRVEELEDEFLRQRGWTHSSNNPGGLWLWEKVIDGDKYKFGKEYALNFETYK